MNVIIIIVVSAYTGVILFRAGYKLGKKDEQNELAKVFDGKQLTIKDLPKDCFEFETEHEAERVRMDIICKCALNDDLITKADYLIYLDLEPVEADYDIVWKDLTLKNCYVREYNGGYRVTLPNYEGQEICTVSTILKEDSDV